MVVVLSMDWRGRGLCQSSFGGGGGGGGESEREVGWKNCGVVAFCGVLGVLNGGAGGMVPLEGCCGCWEFRDLEREWEEKRVHELPEG